MDKTKSFRVAGGILRNGVLIKDSHNDMARSAGAPKRLTVPAPAYGQKRQTTGALSAYHHGVAVCDEPMTTKISGIDGDGSEHLRQASDNFNRGKMGDVQPGQLPSPAAKRNSGR